MEWFIQADGDTRAWFTKEARAVAAIRITATEKDISAETVRLDEISKVSLGRNHESI